MSLEKIKFTKKTDVGLFGQTLKAVFPKLSYDDGYIFEGVVIAETDKDMMGVIGQKLIDDEFSPQFVSYGKYIVTVSGRRANDKTYNNFLKEMRRYTKQKLSKESIRSKSKRKIKLHIEEVDIDHITEEDHYKEFYESGALKREGVIYRTIERARLRNLTYEECKKTYGEYLDKNAENIKFKIEECNDPILSKFVEDLVLVMKRKGWDLERARNLTRDWQSLDHQKTEREDFSYSKVQKILDKYHVTLPTDKIYKHLEKSPLEYYHSLEKYLDDVEGCTDYEELCVKLTFLADVTRHYSQDMARELYKLSSQTSMETPPWEVRECLEIWS